MSFETDLLYRQQDSGGIRHPTAWRKEKNGSLVLLTVLIIWLLFFSWTVPGFSSQGGYRKPLEMLLNLVDKHWTGERSLHSHNFLCELEFGTEERHSWWQPTVKKDMLIIPVLSFCGSSPGSPHPLNDGKGRFHSGERGQDLKRESWYAQRPSFQANTWAPSGSSEPLCSASGRLQWSSKWFLQSKVTFMFIQLWLKLFLSPVSESSWGTSWWKTPLYKSSCSV